MDKIRLQLNTLLNTTRISFYTLFLKPISNFIYIIVLNTLKLRCALIYMVMLLGIAIIRYNMYLLKTAL